MERSLVASKVDLYAFVGKTFPKVHYVAHVCYGHHFAAGDGPSDAGDKFVQVVMEFVHPTLVETLLCGRRIDFGGDADHSGYVAGLGLSS